MVRIKTSSIVKRFIRFFRPTKAEGSFNSFREFWLSQFLWLFLFTPFLILFGYLFQTKTQDQSLTLFSKIEIAELLWALKNTFLQSIGSALLSVFLGFFGVLALLSQPEKSRLRRALELLLLLPNFLPTLFVLTFALSLIQPFPMGIVGIVLIHTLINSGLVSVLWSLHVQKQMASQSQLAYLEGAGRWQFLKAMKAPLFLAARNWILFVFIICFASFTVPLVVGGSKGTTLEVLIFEKLRVSSDIASAFGLSILQGLLVLFFGFIFLRLGSTTSLQKFSQERVLILPSKELFWLLTAFTAAASLYFIKQLFTGWNQVFLIPGLIEQALSLLLKTFVLGFSVAVLTIVLLCLQAAIFLNQNIHHRISKLISISPVLVAFAFSLFLDRFLSIVLLALALTCLYYPSAVRLGLREAFESLRTQQKMSWLLGASPWQTLLRITIPQISKQLVFVSSVVGLWAMGDFAVSKIILGHTETLGVLADSLMSSYRIDASFAICGLILVLGLALFLVLRGIAHVYHQKFS